MKKRYIKPDIVESDVVMTNMFAASPGVDTGDGTGEGYDDKDPSYSKGNMWSFMDDEK